MESGWKRTIPRPVPAREQIHEALVPWLDGRSLEDVEVLPGGLVNLNVSIHVKGGGEGESTVLLRAYLGDDAACAKEHAVLERVPGLVPAPRVLHQGEIVLDRDGHDGATPFLLTTFVEGRPLSETMGSASEDALGRAGRDIGRALARLHALSFDAMGFFDAASASAASLVVAAPMPSLQEVWRSYLLEMLAGRAGTRLGPRAEAVGAFVRSSAEDLAPLEGHHALLHADCKPTNILVDERGAVTAFLDWEFAWAGPPLFDLGQLLRRPVPQVFEETLVTAYGDGGGALPPGWRRQARLLDLMNLVGFLDRKNDDPVRDRDVTGLIDATLEAG